MRAADPSRSSPGNGPGRDQVRVIGVRFLNARPLTAGLEAGLPAPFEILFERADPCACAAELAAGRAVAALVPTAALPSLGAVRVLPTVGIACRREATSVLLVSKRPPGEIRRLAAHGASRSSVALARLLLVERWGARPEVIPASPPLASMLAVADAAVIIGDPALAIHGRTGLLEIDLAAAWVEWTGLPFVFAVWACGVGAPAGLEAVLEASLDWAERRWDELLPRWAGEHGVSIEQAREYLGARLSYRLRDAERTGMALFLERAARADVLRAGEERFGHGASTTAG